MKKPLPAHYKVPRPKTDNDITTEAIDLMWSHTGFYDDESAYRAFLAPATPGQIAIFTCRWYLAEVYNGGHAQFFTNSTGMVWREALEGFRLLGAGPYAVVLGDAIKIFPNDSPAMDRDDREAQFDALGEEIEEDLDALDRRIYDLDNAFDVCAEQYIRAHPDQFFIDP